MTHSKFGAIAFIIAISVAYPACAQRFYSPSYMDGGGAGGYNDLVAADYTYNPRPGWPIRNPDPWANNYRLKHHQLKHHLPSQAQ
jgi:hypothetical protein